MNQTIRTIAVVASCIVAFSARAAAQFSPYAGQDYPTRVFWGDTHLHTSISVDAGTMNRVGQEDAYRFARGEEVTSTGGLRVHRLRCRQNQQQNYECNASDRHGPIVWQSRCLCVHKPPLVTFAGNPVRESLNKSGAAIAP